MPELKEIIKVNDNMGFVYEVRLEHQPHYGFTTAYYKGRIIGQVEHGKIHQPFGDDDREWERYEEVFADWVCAVKFDLLPICSQALSKKPKRGKI